MSEVSVEATTYTVTAVPVEVPQAYLWALTVEKRGTGSWSVNNAGYCLCTDGNWDYEPIPSERSDNWRLRCNWRNARHPW
jgi:hypothetical protein